MMVSPGSADPMEAGSSFNGGRCGLSGISQQVPFSRTLNVPEIPVLFFMRGIMGETFRVHQFYL